MKKIRLWTLGKITDNPQTTILPTKESVEKLQQTIAQIKNVDQLDIVWGPELTVQEFVID